MFCCWIHEYFERCCHSLAIDQCVQNLRRVAIFEKLATISETSFDDADLLQLYQAQSLLDPPGVLPSTA